MNKKLIISLALTLLLTSIATATTWNVSSGGPYTTIQAAINVAVSGDDVNVADGTYTGTGNRNLDFGGKAITVHSASGNPAACIINCQNYSRAFYFHHSETTTSVVQGFTIIDGNEYYGGAIECEVASPTINNCILTGNAADYGGAIDCFLATPVIKNCTISNNTSTYDGSAIECETSSSPQITNCLIISNTAGGKGSIDCYSTGSSDSSSPQIKNCTIANNVGSSNYGGVYAWSVSHPTIRNSILWNNIDDIFGSAVISSYSCIKNTDSGTGVIHTDPLFRAGPLGNYYLSQIAAGQSANSPCRNGSVDTVISIYNPWQSYTTRTDYVPDDPNTTVDIGYHYPTTGTFKQYSLTTSVVGAPSGHGTIAPIYASPGQLINAYTQVPLHATPDTDYEVDVWSGTLNTRPTDVNNNVVTVDANKTVTVKFRSKTMYQLNTSVNGGNGTVTPVSGPQRKDTAVTLTAVPASGYRVLSWSGTDNPSSTSLTNTVTMTGIENVIVAFEPNTFFQLRTQVDNGSDGQPHGTISPRAGNYLLGTPPVTLTANPDTNYKVKYWSINGIIDHNSTALSYYITMNSSKMVNVEFELKPLYTLTVNVTPSIRGTATITSPLTPPPYYEDTVVTIAAHPNTGYTVGSWTGTNNDSSILLTNTVTMTSNKTVSLQFVGGRMTQVHSDDTNGIQSAINQASNGDTIQLLPGTYAGNYFLVNKPITIIGDPEHPENVVIDYSTPISFYGSTGFDLRGQTGNPNPVILNGVTIKNLNTSSWTPCDTITPGANGNDSPDHYSGAIIIYGSHKVLNCVIQDCNLVVNKACDGEAGGDPNKLADPNGGYGGKGGDSGGAGIVINSGSPNIMNVLIDNCIVHGGNGGNGAQGFYKHQTGDPNKYPQFPPGLLGKGGRGGNAIGGGICIKGGSHATFTDVIVSNCKAIAGSGGNGADALTGIDANDIFKTSGNPLVLVGADGNLPGKAMGGGIYDAGTSPTFINCSVENCIAYGGKGGNGGNGTSVKNKYYSYYGGGGFGGLTTDSAANQGDLRFVTADGGAVFCGSTSKPIFTNCSITGNKVFGSVSGLGGKDWQGLHNLPWENTRLPANGAGVMCLSTSASIFVNCNFENNKTAFSSDYSDPNYTKVIHFDDVNKPTEYKGEYTGIGGGLCLCYPSRVDINNCNFTANHAPMGAGIYSISSDIHIRDCNVTNNISYSGGGILAQDTSVEIKQSHINNNTAGTQLDSSEDIGYALYGSGGGIYSVSSLLDINDTEVTANSARVTGGGICIDGDWTHTPYTLKPVIKNCLITKNSAVEDGGGIASIYFAEPLIQDCTIAENYVQDTNSSGGGLFCSYESDTIVKDTIFWKNSGINGSQIGLSDGGLYTDMPAGLTISYSDIDLRYNVIDFNSMDSTSASTSSLIAAKLVSEQTIYDAINTSGSAKVIVTLVQPSQTQSTNWSSSASVSALQSKIATLQTQAISMLNPGEFTLRQKLTNSAVFSGTVTVSGLNKLLTSSMVAHIEPVRITYPALAQGIPLMNAMSTRPTYNGQGIAVAIVDTGIDYTHPKLGGPGFPNSKVIGGYDTADRDSDPIPSATTTEGGHGTCCAGIVAGMLGTVGDYIGGVAYNAKIYALKASPNASDGLPSDATLAAWDWCITHKNDDPANPILVISNSWGTTTIFFNNSSDADAYSPAHTTAAQTAVNAGITILGCSHNQYQTNGICWPSAMSNVISVGAVYDAAFISQACRVQTQADRVTCYSNTASILSVLAPSENAYTTDIVGANGFSTGDYYQYFNGTSAACPYAAGAVAALQSAAKQIRGQYLTPSQVRILLTTTGVPVTDTKVAITKPRINLGAAIALLGSSTPVYSERSCSITGLAQDANGKWTASGTTNISKDPNFVPGLGYYLSSKATGQDFNSPCFDIGSALASSLGLDTYTTRADGFKDTGIVDLGYHYSQGITTNYTLTVDINGPHWGTIAPSPGTHPTYLGQMITLEADPNANYAVATWFVDDVNQQTDGNTLTIVINKNEKVAVRFKHIAAVVSSYNNIYVPSQYPDLGSAIDAAKDGDKIILSPGTYNWNKSNFDYPYIYIDGKNITITGTAPEDPCTVAQTVIFGNDFTILDVNNTMTIEGITIQDAHFYPGVVDCAATWSHSVNGDGYNGYNLLGGAMRLYNASPTIRNCQFINCSAMGSNGCDGSGTSGDGGWAGWAHGGAIGIDETSNPVVKNCNFINCYVQGGNAGNGINGNPGGHGGNWGDPKSSIWDFGPYQPYWYYTGKGGAIYCESGSKPIFENCFFQGNTASGGTCGTSDTTHHDNWPQFHYAIPSFGGAVYIARGSQAKFTDCIFIDNDANTMGQLGSPTPTSTFVLYSPVVSYGGALCTENTGFEDANDAIPTIENCKFINNRACVGGGAYWKGATGHLKNNIFENCTSMMGGGIALVDSNSTIIECNISNNIASNAAGQGGGIYCDTSNAMFYDSQIRDNNAVVSGGGVYFTGNAEPNMHNCLITNNNANSNGGGISANWNTTLRLSNCTITNNTASGIGFTSGYGGALSCDYDANTAILNSILRNDIAAYGPEISIGNSSDSADKRGAKVSVSYSDVTGGSADAFVDTPHGCILNWGAGNIITNPLFATGFLGNYYLSQTPLQTDNSPCVNTGSGSAISRGMYKHTTRTDNVIDFGIVDMGYHYVLASSGLLGDLNFDGAVNLEDLAIFMLYWLDNNCSYPYWCNGTDLNEDGRVDFEDFALFAENYGKNETVPPIPDPMTWAISPQADSTTSITMTATTAIDTSGPVEYYFQCVSGGGHNRDWGANRLYTDAGLTTGTEYGYKVKARDIYHNETGLSVTGKATPSIVDTTPPTVSSFNPPDNSTGVGTDANLVINFNKNVSAGTGNIVIKKTLDNSVIETIAANNAKVTIASAKVTINPATTLLVGSEYYVQIAATCFKDSFNNYYAGISDTTSWSFTVGGGTPPVVDVDAPTPYPSWSVTPRYTTSDGIYFYLNMAAGTVTDATLPVYYKFQCVSSGGTSSDWQLSPTWSIGPFIAQGYAVYVIYTKDSVVPTPNVAGPSPKVDTNGAVLP
ncbi:MAG: S8 family serine peptidase [Sedimentisphaerales bacterium]